MVLSFFAVLVCLADTSRAGDRASLQILIDRLAKGSNIPAAIKEQYRSVEIAEALISRKNNKAGKRSNQFDQAAVLLRSMSLQNFSVQAEINDFQNIFQATRDAPIRKWNPKRIEAEDEMAGLKLGTDEIGLELRPKYSILMHPTLRGEPQYYGDVTLVLKDEVKGRSTFTLGDSLGNYIFHKSHPSKFPPQETHTFAEQFSEISVRDPSFYIEAQTYGQITLADVKEVWVPPNTDLSELTVGAINALQKAGTPVFFHGYSEEGHRVRSEVVSLAYWKTKTCKKLL